ncbi:MULTISPECIES: acetyl-CoA carboxylase biotin carboxyl carrier protein [unclassified Romboutsia]|uniref:acetyl-CoA carboxylase biotin carboxyl carrier protein n=1 Tax=unclassified Romboutsia TaxID=2626894 RepID=UPI000822420F|nr:MULTISPECIES: acetyl-CoA carboxylase biotin carboxyl carrier protein [unclassified Romboutsia]SCH64042.1 Biotin carboxyl carrier protein of acetyl-CoA carboxylase [uncultured Clostridium sp.]
MNFNEVKELINIINNSDLSYFEMQDDKEFIKIDKSITRNYIQNSIDGIDAKSINRLAITDLSEGIEIREMGLIDDGLNISNKDSLKITDSKESFEFIKSPIVGTFYEAMSPEDNPFVSVGQRVNKGDVICIVEAMKLMNEISAEYDCEIVSVLGKNGEMVQYGDSLFKVRRV